MPPRRHGSRRGRTAFSHRETTSWTSKLLVTSCISGDVRLCRSQDGTVSSTFTVARKDASSPFAKRLEDIGQSS
ncbi:hypothetical protein CC78DRAFT_533489 [Lojkania enalia]|uniref:Uncharacterized protein n=1 Tax=Lojkania enalia TaxID=147567 RepID=A0A9P4N888_9PLEO|nr:hypothetical protein CC78DRAFT_533489 [Didymosphaeria enalia]